MGAKGIRRRKVVHPLPHVPAQVEPPEDAPPVMWPGAGSGFEADPFSPAGQAQAMWRFWDGIRSKRDLPKSGALRLLSWLLTILVGIPVVVATVYGLIHLFTR